MFWKKLLVGWLSLGHRLRGAGAGAGGWYGALHRMRMAGASGQAGNQKGCKRARRSGSHLLDSRRAPCTAERGQPAGPTPTSPIFKSIISSRPPVQCTKPRQGGSGPAPGPRGALFFSVLCCHSALVLGTFLVTQLFSGHFLFKEVRGSSVLEKPRRNYKKRLHLPRPTARTLNGRLSSGPSRWKQGALAPTSTLSWWTLRGEPPSPPTPSTAKGQDEG